MSLANRCDRCGDLIPGSANFEKENLDIAILIDGEIVCSYEDLCQNCSKTFKALLTNYQNPTKREKQQPKEIEQVEVPLPPEEEPIPQNVPETDPINEQDEDEDALPQRPAELSERVVKQIPIKLKSVKTTPRPFDD